MFKILFSCCLLYICCTAGAQSVDLDKFYFKTQEVHFPKYILPADTRTYSYREYNRGEDVSYGIDSMIHLNGFTKRDSGTVLLSSHYSPLEWVEQKTALTPGSTTKYVTTIKAQSDGRIRVECPAQDYKWYTLDKFVRTYTTPEFDTPGAALKAFENSRLTWIDDANLKWHQYVALQTNYRGNMFFGYAAHVLTIKLFLLNEKDHPEYAKVQEHFTTLKNAFAEVKYTHLPADILTKLAPVISYYEGIPAAYAEDNKQHKKMRYSAYYALMKIYYHTDQLDQAAKYAGLVVSNDFDPKDGKRMLEEIQERRATLEKYAVPAFHFNPGGDTGTNIYTKE